MSHEEDAREDFGVFLRAARERKGLSLQDLSATTKISLRVLQALEDNDIARVPGGLFGRAFVRAYAEEVGLDPETAAALFVEAFPEKDAPPAGTWAAEPGTSMGHPGEGAPSPGFWLLLVGVPVVGFLAFLAMRLVGPPDVVEPAPPSEVVERIPIDPPLPSSPALRSPTVSSGLETGAGSDPAAVGPLTIEIYPSAACWVSLTVDGERVLSRILQPGDREVYEARDGLVLNVGDAGAFDFSINQQPGRALGASGDSVTVEIDHDNYRSFVTR